MITLRLTPGYCLAIYCLTAITHTLHEFVHHATAYAICGQWGAMSFNSFRVACEMTPVMYLSTYAGPAFTFALMWAGMFLLQSGGVFARQLGFALTFAQTPWQRMLMPFFQKNDEYYASAQLFGGGHGAALVVAVAIWAICLPPLIAAFQAIANRRRIAWFAFFFLIFPFVIYALAYWLLESLLQQGVLADTVIGVPMLAIINFALTLAVLALTIRHISPSPPEVTKAA